MSNDIVRDSKVDKKHGEGVKTLANGSVHNALCECDCPFNESMMMESILIVNK